MAKPDINVTTLLGLQEKCMAEPKGDGTPHFLERDRRGKPYCRMLSDRSLVKMLVDAGHSEGGCECMNSGRGVNLPAKPKDPDSEPGYHPRCNYAAEVHTP